MSHGKEHRDYLLNTLRTVYTIKTRDGSKYLGMILELVGLYESRRRKINACWILGQNSKTF